MKFPSRTYFSNGVVEWDNTLQRRNHLEFFHPRLNTKERDRNFNDVSFLKSKRVNVVITLKFKFENFVIKILSKKKKKKN
jgi:hypothetical protein